MNGDSDSNKNSNSDGSNKNRSFRLQVEATMAQRFIKAMEIRMKQLEVTSAQDFKLSQHERTVLMDVVKANLLEGAAAGFITFFVLRRLHAAYFNYLKRGFAEQNMAIRRPTVPNAFNSPYQQIPNKPLSQAQTNIPNMMENAAAASASSAGKSGANGSFGTARWMVNATSFVFDGIVSFYIAVFVSTRNPEKFLKEVSDLPLMEGESVVSKELCPILLDELKKIHSDLEHDNTNTNAQMLPKISTNNKEVVRDSIADPQTAILQCLMNFCTNCRRRAAYEQILREQSGASSDDVISIPPPGVPPTLDVTNDIAFNSSADSSPLVTEMTSEDAYNDSNFDDTTGTTASSDWTESFDADQEEKRRK